ncbi:MAG: pectate lyase [Bacteroidales bacterium]|nr:pectate lyase [Bacteroidales bacterium]
MNKWFLPCLVLCLGPLVAAQPPQALTVTPDRQIRYNTYDNGDRVPDYSYCGYLASEAPIPDLLADPDVPVVRVAPSGRDDTQRIQDALDYVGGLPLRPDGFRGVVLLERGNFPVEGSLVMRCSGVVIRGSGALETSLFAAGQGRETVVQVRGVNDAAPETALQVQADYLPVNAAVVPLPAGHGLQAGDRVRVTRPATREWIHLLGMDNIGMSADYQHWLWAPGDYDLVFDRTVVAADAGSVTLDVPLPVALDGRYGGGTLARYTWPGRISHVGVENLRILSDCDPALPKDEDHRWMAITFENVEDAWARRIVAEHFVSSLAAVWETARRVTVEDCKNLAPVGEIGGYRRLAFQTRGQQTLFQRCWSEEGWHDFSVGENAAGPNAFVQCWAERPHSWSGALGGWSCGTLFDRTTVSSAAIKFTNVWLDNMGGGWASANALCWMCRTPELYLEDPPLAHNWAFGTSGQSYGAGSHGEHKINHPESFYYYQLAQRGVRSAEADKVIRYERIFGENDPLKRVFPEEAVAEGRRSVEPAETMDRWIDAMTARHPLAQSDRGVDIGSLGIRHPAPAPAKARPIALAEGKLVREGAYLPGGTARTQMWQGMLRRSYLRRASDNINRFVPGRTGRGYTDDLDSVVFHLQQRGQAGLYHFPALWYERRRDDHGRMMRADAEVWAPFLEQPFARSGQGEAYDRLSRYDLERPNPWYWSRIAAFCQRADAAGLFLVSEHYLQHNIIEEGAHWADYPWRAANNVNDPGFAEETYYQADKRVFMAEQFYDVEHNARLAALHRRYIRQQLDAVAPYRNVIHHIGTEYTGPLHFIRFWLDCIAEWEQEHGQDVYVMLSATKDVQDAILADPEYRSRVELVDIRQWQRTADGAFYEPEGGVNLAPRQYSRLLDAPATSGDDAVWRQVAEYRLRYPGIAVVSNAGRAQGGAWVSFVAGGSMCALPPVPDASFWQKTLPMAPMEALASSGAQWGMGRPGSGYVVYCAGESLVLPLGADSTGYRLRWIDPVTGAWIGRPQRVRGGADLTLPTPKPGAVAWLDRS